MSYQALYLKYRPQKFEDVAGQKAIVSTLQNSLKNNKIAHAYLFCGPRGTGKTSLARLFAKALNCEKGLGKQCLECENCLEIKQGTHPDVIEIDAASNNGVDQVRELVDNVKYSPIKGRYKIYIIDEVHMMSSGAFNALLKTLEEPPDNVVFILCTTEPHKVIPTIISRCQRYDFARINRVDLKNKLIEILEKENAQYEEKGLESIVDLADGGLRDGISILDQVLSYANNSLKEKDVLTIFGLTSENEKYLFLKLINRLDVTSLLNKIHIYINNGVDFKRYVVSMIEIIKNLIIYNRTKDIKLVQVSNETEFINLNNEFTIDKLNFLIERFIKLENDLKLSNDAATIFELAVLQMATTSLSEDNKEEIVKKPIETKEIKLEEKNEENQSQITKEETKKIENSKKEEPPAFLFEDENKTIKNEELKQKEETKTSDESLTLSIDLSNVKDVEVANNGEMFYLDDEEIIKIMVLADKNERVNLFKKWNDFKLLTLNSKVSTLANIISSGNPFCLCNQALIIAYNYKHQKEKANIKANQKGLQEMIEGAIGRKVFVYGIDNYDRSRLLNNFYNKQTINQLPKKNEIILNLPQ